MFDIKLIEQSNLAYDVEFENGDFKIDDGLETALIVSLLSDRRADESQIFQPELRRGWIGDLVATLPGYKFGSHIWLSEQSRLTQETLTTIQDASEKSLDWMLSIGLILNVEAKASIVVKDSTVLLIVSVTSPDGSVSKKAFNLWKRTIENAN